MSTETKHIEQIAQDRYDWQQKYFALREQNKALVEACQTVRFKLGNFDQFCDCGTCGQCRAIIEMEDTLLDALKASSPEQK